MNTTIILTTQQFCDKMQISKSTFFKWKRNGMFRVGKDIIPDKKGHKILWGKDLINYMLSWYIPIKKG